jgi:hypothetical protein
MFPQKIAEYWSVLVILLGLALLPQASSDVGASWALLVSVGWLFLCVYVCACQIAYVYKRSHHDYVLDFLESHVHGPTKMRLKIFPAT